ncbi:MAG TPA: carboxymuconolactone decarboxylase family protein [Aliidongia sp.]|nr:carboxymuconolactone decarboxylase family protein [Aliidongia sp.]
MTPARPRLEPLPEQDWNDEQREVLAPFAERGHIPNIFTTLAHHPKLLKRWLVFANHILGKSSLPGREREILILRIGWLCRAEYEWGQHVQIGRRAGLTSAEIARISAGPNAPGWSPIDAALLRAVDELHRDAVISDATWAALATRFDTQQLLDIIFTVGNYNLVSMALNSLGVRLDEGIPGFDQLDCDDFGSNRPKV